VAPIVVQPMARALRPLPHLYPTAANPPCADAACPHPSDKESIFLPQAQLAIGVVRTKDRANPREEADSMGALAPAGNARAGVG
jgi:hypothetical protein